MAFKVSWSLLHPMTFKVSWSSKGINDFIQKRELFLSKKQRRAMFPVDVVPPSLLGWSIFMPVFSINRLEANFMEFVRSGEDGDRSFFLSVGGRLES